MPDDPGKTATQVKGDSKPKLEAGEGTKPESLSSVGEKNVKPEQHHEDGSGLKAAARVADMNKEELIGRPGGGDGSYPGPTNTTFRDYRELSNAEKRTVDRGRSGKVGSNLIPEPGPDDPVLTPLGKESEEKDRQYEQDQAKEREQAKAKTL